MSDISIITPLYNCSKTFAETAESVLSQDYGNWEWILFDDGSTDGTQEMAKKFSSDHKDKILYYEHDNKLNFGAGYTRNRAVEKSSAELISFIDADDVWNKNYLSTQVKILKGMPEAAMIWSPVLYWYKERSFKQPVEFNGVKLKSGIFKPPEFVEIFLKNLRGTPCPSSTIVRRKNYIEAGGYEESLRISEDIALWLKLANKFPIYYLDEILIKYRKHEDSTLRKASQSNKINELDLLYYRWAINFLKENSAKKDLIEMNEFAYYTCLKKISKRQNYIEGRKHLLSGLGNVPDLRKKYLKDFLLDLVLPLDLATKISAKLRFDIFKSK